MKRLAIIGASYLQAPLIQKAKDMGCETHVFAWAADDVGEKMADHFYPISIVEKDAILEKCREIGIDGICTIASDLAAITVNYVAEKLGIDRYHAELLPADKVEHVEQLLAAKPKGKSLAFVGDGINDAPVLKRADIGIAMGGLGSDAAIEAADVVLMDDRPSKIATAIRIARRTLRIARQNVWFAIGIKVAILVLASIGLGSMWMAVFADVGVTVLAVLNAMRALH